MMDTIKEDQFAPRAVGPKDLACWEHLAYLEVPHIRPDHTNWPMIVRSLVAEVRRLNDVRS